MYLHLHRYHNQVADDPNSGLPVIPRPQALINETNVIQHDTAPTYICDVCGSNFQSLDLLDVNYYHCLKKNSQDWLLSAELSPQQRTAMSQPEGMDSSVIPDPIHVCSACDDLFYSLNRLKDHMWNIHGKDVDLMCHECDNFFVSKSALSIHTINFHPKVQCHLCDFFAQLPKDLMKHIQTTHKNILMVCTICEVPFNNADDLDEHIMRNHSPSFNFDEFAELVLSNDCSSPSASCVTAASFPGLLSCLKCKKTFELYVDLTDHMKALHETTPFYSCDVCEMVFPSIPELQSHLDEDHTGYVITGLEDSSGDFSEMCHTSCSEQEPLIQNDHEEEPIDQLDGLDLDFYEFNDVPPDTTVRTASYSLNQGKQTMKIVKDASINDYDITINNDEQNVTIKCSAGFYIQVARPYFSTIKNGTVMTQAPMVIALDDIKETIDKNGIEATKLMHFSFMSNQTSCGGVRVHLHHSTRTIQIQGSHVMSNNQRAAAWFLKSVVLLKFNDLAKTKKFAINNFNNAVLKMNHVPASLSSSDHSNVCQACFMIFDSKSKPSRCPTCSKFFHKTKCHKDHSRSCRAPSLPKQPSVSSSLGLPSFSRVSNSLSAYSTQALSSSSNSSPAVPSLQSLTPTSPALPQISNSAPVTSSLSRSFPGTSFSQSTTATAISGGPPHTAPSSSLSRLPGLQTAISFVPQTISATISYPTTTTTLSSQSTSQTTSRGTTKRTERKKQKSPPTSTEQATIDFLQTELNAAQARIVMLDATINDKEQELSVLWARIKILEEKQNKDILGKYFPHKPAPTSAPKSPAPIVPTPGPLPRSCATSSGACRSTPPSCSTSPCHASSPPCAHICCPCNISCARVGHQCTQNDDLLKKVDEVYQELHGLRTSVNAIKTSVKNFPETTVGNASNSSKDLLDATNVLDASIATVEEQMSDIEDDLNCQDPTIQLPQLKL